MKVGAQFTIDKHMFMINYCNKNGARTMAFIMIVKVTHITFTPDNGMIPFEELLAHRKIVFLTSEVFCCALFTFFTIKKLTIVKFVLTQTVIPGHLSHIITTYKRFHMC